MIRTLHNFKSSEVMYQLGVLAQELHDKQSDGENTYAVIDAFVSKFERIPKEAINYPEIQGFLAYHLADLIIWFRKHSDHQLWNVSQYDQKTRQSLIKLGDILKALDYPRYSNSASCFAWLLATIEAGAQSPRDSLLDNHNQTHTTSSDPANEPERKGSANIQAEDLQAGELQAADLQTGELHAGELQAGELQAGDLKVEEL
ncbi:uncharacterized protein EAF01_007855 [Botrytis porri]|uniref:Uncharacterized protein n=1 Tax=Botrytis porri TaxID=87229 RepID=A0A4Z1K9L7_9HELO|nr:uncharacterized protein EAF01_007855 [Botrytis porri]KAF7900553.1 hypothetical protein EAF01_007855 [Botrytis porri]TGO82148.1 hypothetical protein BPOR_0907g00010 [Botrytis porri]